MHFGVPGFPNNWFLQAAVTVAEPLLRPASFDQAEAAVEDTEALEGQALPAPLPVLAAELGAPADAPAATKAWSLSAGARTTLWSLACLLLRGAFKAGLPANCHVRRAWSASGHQAWKACC